MNFPYTEAVPVGPLALRHSGSGDGNAGNARKETTTTKRRRQYHAKNRSKDN